MAPRTDKLLLALWLPVAAGILGYALGIFASQHFYGVELFGIRAYTAMQIVMIPIVGWSASSICRVAAKQRRKPNGMEPSIKAERAMGTSASALYAVAFLFAATPASCYFIPILAAIGIIFYLNGIRVCLKQ